MTLSLTFGVFFYSRGGGFLYVEPNIKNCDGILWSLLRGEPRTWLQKLTFSIGATLIAQEFGSFENLAHSGK